MLVSILMKNHWSILRKLIKITKLHQFFKNWIKLILKKFEDKFDIFERQQRQKKVIKHIFWSITPIKLTKIFLLEVLLDWF